MAPQPEDIDINVYKSHRSSPRWEFCKGFFKGGFGAAILGLLAGAAIGLLAMTAATIVAPESAIAFGEHGIKSTLMALEVSGIIGLATGIFSGSVAGYNHAKREQRSALAFNKDVDGIIQAKVLKANGVELSIAKDEAPAPAQQEQQQGQGGWVKNLANRATSIVTGETPGGHLQALMDRSSDNSELGR